MLTPEGFRFPIIKELLVANALTIAFGEQYLSLILGAPRNLEPLASSTIRRYIRFLYNTPRQLDRQAQRAQEASDWLCDNNVCDLVFDCRSDEYRGFDRNRYVSVAIGRVLVRFCMTAAFRQRGNQLQAPLGTAKRC